MNVLDENIVASQCEQLRRWRIPFHQIGQDIGRKGMDDAAEIIPLLHQLPRPTFLTRDGGFYQRSLCHPGYCLVVLAVPREQAAHYIRRILRHPGFSSRAKRMGCVVRVSSTEISNWQRYATQEEVTPWSRQRTRR